MICFGIFLIFLILYTEGCEHGLFYPKDGDCSFYYRCVYGKLKQYKCNSGLHWNQHISNCDWPQNSGCKQDVEEHKVICYFTNWAWYRQGNGKFLPENIDPMLCTHIVYAFAVLDENLYIKSHDTWADIDNKFYERVTQFKNKGVKVLIGIGGWNDSAGGKYSRLVNNAASRNKFVTNVVEFILKHNFDGLDLDWEYPKCWQGECTSGPASDKKGFSDWITEIREAFIPHGLLLSAAVSAAKRVIDPGYDVKLLSDKLDWIGVMAYDYHGQWDRMTGHIAPLYGQPGDKDFNANYSISYWIEQGADPKKLILGMPMYGQSFTLSDVNKNGLNAPTIGGGEAGEMTVSSGILSYYEISNRIKKGWKVVQNNGIGPYAFKDNQWVGYDDIAQIERKSEYIKFKKLGGAMIWALDFDDFHHEYPLLTTINKVLRN